MNVLGINGSPHREGNTAYALRYALGVIEDQGIETTYISLAGKGITPCDGCFVCRKGECVHEDDMGPIYDALRRCDGLVLASPVYMGLVTGQMYPLTQIAQLRRRPARHRFRYASLRTRTPSRTTQG